VHRRANSGLRSPAWRASLEAAFKSSLQDVEDFEERTAAKFYGMQPPKPTQPGDLYELPSEPHQ